MAKDWSQNLLKLSMLGTCPYDLQLVGRGNRVEGDQPELCEILSQNIPYPPKI